MLTTLSTYLPTNIVVTAETLPGLSNTYVVDLMCNETVQLRLVGLRYYQLIELLDKFTKAILTIEVPDEKENTL